MEPLDYLVIAPHPDDAELGVGGTILLLQAQGARVGVLDLTDGEPTPHGSPEVRRRETEAATAVLGLAWRGNLGLANRCLEADLEARAKLAGALRQLRPRVLFAPYWEDAHPDHVAASALVDAARFWAKLTKSNLPGTPHFPQRIDGLVGGNRVDPRADRTPLLIQAPFQMDLEERVLEHVLRQSGIAEIAC